MDKNYTDGFVLLTEEEHENLMQIIKDLSLCLEDNDDLGHQTHYIFNSEPMPQIRAKGSFIALVQKAKDVMEAAEEE